MSSCVSAGSALTRKITRSNRNLRVASADAFEQFQTTELRHFQVSDHNVDGKLFQHFQCLLGCRGGADSQPGLYGRIAAEIASCSLVVHNKDGHNGWLELWTLLLGFRLHFPPHFPKWGAQAVPFQETMSN